MRGRNLAFLLSSCPSKIEVNQLTSYHRLEIRHWCEFVLEIFHPELGFLLDKILCFFYTNHDMHMYLKVFCCHFIHHYTSWNDHSYVFVRTLEHSPPPKYHQSTCTCSTCAPCTMYMHLTVICFACQALD